MGIDRPGLGPIGVGQEDVVAIRSPTVTITLEPSDEAARTSEDCPGKSSRSSEPSWLEMATLAWRQNPESGRAVLLASGEGPPAGIDDPAVGRARRLDYRRARRLG